MPHRRAIYPLTMLLTVATAIALFFAGWVLATPSVAEPGSGNTAQVVREFYEAVNQALSTGNAGSLDAVVDKRLVVHGPLATLAPDRAGLIRYLMCLHATIPQLRLNVVNLSATTNRAVAELAVQGADEGRFLGSSLHLLSPWGAVDSLLVGGHRVLELWTDADGLELQGPISQAPFAATPDARHVVTLDRLTFAPRTSFMATSAGELRWLIGGQGNVTVTVMSIQESQSALSASTTSRLESGQILAVPPWSQTDIRNDGHEEVNLLVLAISQLDMLNARMDTDDQQSQTSIAAEPGAPPWPTGASQVSVRGVEISSLTGGVVTDLPPDAAVVSLAEAAIAPGAGLADLKIGGPWMLVVDVGTLGLVTPDGSTMTDQGTGKWRYSGTLNAGSAALLPLDSRADLRNRGEDPVLLTIIAFLPASALAGDAA